MAAINLLMNYGSDSDSSAEDKDDHISTPDPSKSIVALKEKFQINSAPLVEIKVMKEILPF